MKLRSDIASAAREMTSSQRVARELRQLAARLREGEVVHRLASGVYGDGYGLLAVTDQRVVLLQDSRARQASSGFALKRLSVAGWAPGEAAGTITIADSDSSIELGGVPLAEGEQIVELVRSRMVSEIGPQVEGPQPTAEPSDRHPPLVQSDRPATTGVTVESPELEPPVPARSVTSDEAPRSTAARLWGAAGARLPARSSSAPGSPTAQDTATSRHLRSSNRHRRGRSMSRADWLVIGMAVTFVLTGICAYALVSRPSAPASRTGSGLAGAASPPAAVSDDAGRTATVARVIDGASIEISGPEREPIRVLGILAPSDDDCHAAESKAYASSTLRGAIVTLDSDPSQPAQDRTGRRQAHVKLSDGADYAVLAARAGAVKYFPTDPPVALADQIKAAEADARESDEGLWGPPCNGSFTALDSTDLDSTDLDSDNPDSDNPDSDNPDSAAADLTGGAGTVDGLEGADSSTGFRSGNRTERKPLKPDSGSSTSPPDDSPRGEPARGPRLYPERIVPPALGGR